MKSIKILHISDLHRGGTWSVDTVGDYKDHAVSESFAGSMMASMEADFIDAIQKWQQHHGQINAIICSGDLGDRGDANRIMEGVSFISMIGDALGVEKNNVLICPGNHDANRGTSSDSIFKGYRDALTKYSFIDHRFDTKPCVINGIPFLVVNSCLGAAEKSLFVQKYKELVKNLSDSEKSQFLDELKSAKHQYLDDCLDIPAVTREQRGRVVKAIEDDNSSFVVVVMHHSLFPCNTVEIRPYSGVLDAGVTIEALINTEKDVLILHGHVHFPTSTIISCPDNVSFVSSVGTGLFNGTAGSSVNIIEIFCSDEGEHIITLVYEYVKQVNGLQYKKLVHILGKKGKDCLNVVLQQFEQNPDKGIRFCDLLSIVHCSERDLLSTILLNHSVFSISRNKSNNVIDWQIHRK